jgi:hypothetical protein
MPGPGRSADDHVLPGWPAGSEGQQDTHALSAGSSGRERARECGVRCGAERWPGGGGCDHRRNASRQCDGAALGAAVQGKGMCVIIIIIIVIIIILVIINIIIIIIIIVIIISSLK